jgi:hypothetical protein
MPCLAVLSITNMGCGGRSHLAGSFCRIPMLCRGLGRLFVLIFLDFRTSPLRYEIGEVIYGSRLRHIAIMPRRRR